MTTTHTNTQPTLTIGPQPGSPEWIRTRKVYLDGTELGTVWPHFNGARIVWDEWHAFGAGPIEGAYLHRDDPSPPQPLIYTTAEAAAEGLRRIYEQRKAQAVAAAHAALDYWRVQP